MSIKCQTPCDFGECPYNAMYSRDCEYFCGADEPDDYPDAEYFSGEDMELFEVDFCDEQNRDSYGEFSYFMETEDDYYGSD